MKPEKIEQKTLNTPKRYLFSITKENWEMEEDYAIYNIRVYQRRVKKGFVFPENIGEFDVAYMDDGDLFFKHLELGIEKYVHLRKKEERG